MGLLAVLVFDRSYMAPVIDRLTAPDGKRTQNLQNHNTTFKQLLTGLDKTKRQKVLEERRQKRWSAEAAELAAKGAGLAPMIFLEAKGRRRQ